MFRVVLGRGVHAREFRLISWVWRIPKFGGSCREGFAGGPLELLFTCTVRIHSSVWMHGARAGTNDHFPSFVQVLSFDRKRRSLLISSLVHLFCCSQAQCLNNASWKQWRFKQISICWCIMLPTTSTFWKKRYNSKFQTRVKMEQNVLLFHTGFNTNATSDTAFLLEKIISKIMSVSVRWKLTILPGDCGTFMKPYTKKAYVR